MKTVIVSDVKGQSASIIPYGLHLAKRLDSEVEVMHVIDPRVQQGVSSMYGDSSSVSPAKKMSHEEIIQREKQQVEMDLDQILSSEASRLNYPLKINVLVEEDSLERKLKQLAEKDPDTVFVINKEADQYMFESRKEIAEICKEVNGMSLLVPPGLGFTEYENVLLPASFEAPEIVANPEVIDFLNHFRPIVNAIGDGRKSSEPEAVTWTQSVSGALHQSSVHWKLVASDHFESDFIEFVEMVNPDLTLVFEKPKGLLESIFKKELIIELLERTNTPVLFFNHK